MNKRDSTGKNMADRVRALDDGTRSSAEIVKLVGCHPSYVRAVRYRGAGYQPMSESRFVETWEQRKRRRQRERAQASA